MMRGWRLFIRVPRPERREQWLPLQSGFSSVLSSDLFSPRYWQWARLPENMPAVASQSGLPPEVFLVEGRFGLRAFRRSEGVHEWERAKWFLKRKLMWEFFPEKFAKVNPPWENDEERRMKKIKRKRGPAYISIKLRGAIPKGGQKWLNISRSILKNYTGVWRQNILPSSAPNATEKLKIYSLMKTKPWLSTMRK